MADVITYTSALIKRFEEMKHDARLSGVHSMRQRLAERLDAQMSGAAGVGGIDIRSDLAYVVPYLMDPRY